MDASNHNHNAIISPTPHNAIISPPQAVVPPRRHYQRLALPPLALPPLMHYSNLIYSPPSYYPPALISPPIIPGRQPFYYYPNFDRNWSTGLFDCFSNMKNCCKTLCCPCIVFGEIAEIVNEGETPWYEPAVLHLLLQVVPIPTPILPISPFTIPYMCLYRSKMRKRYMLKGGELDDCLANTLCGYCALCQQYRELENQGFNVSLGWHANVERQRQAMAQFRPPVEQAMRR